jgi:hypothetical protein
VRVRAPKGQRFTTRESRRDLPQFHKNPIMSKCLYTCRSAAYPCERVCVTGRLNPTLLSDAA